MAGFWGRLFGRFTRGDASGGEAPSERVTAILEELKARGRPCLRLAPGGAGGSRLGGAPEMTGEWPRYEGRPLSLVAQLDLGEMRAAQGPDWLPAEGRLLFFYDLEYSGWGYDPKDAGCAVVRHERGAAAAASAPDDLAETLRLDAHLVGFTADVSIPSEERLEIDWRSLTRQDERALEAAVEAFTPPEPSHQVGGYPGPIQDDGMERQCQLVSNGVYMGKDVRQSAEITALERGADDWRLLLQVDSDEDAGLMWGDTGRLYFWIREQDARAGDFTKTWTILQCF